MKRIPIQAFLPILAAAILLGTPTESKALCCLFDWWGAYRPTYASYYAPTYGASYAPTYSASYAPSYYSAAYVPSTSYYGFAGSGSSSSCCPTGCCGLQTSYSVPSCCSPCTSCVSCPSNCTNCPGGDCGLASSSDPNPTPATPRAGTTGQTPTFLDEADPGTGTQYDKTPMTPTNNPTEDGFSPRKPEEMMDPLDQQPFGDKDASVTQTVRFKMPESVIQRREPAPTHRPESKPYATRKVNNIKQPQFSLENLDEKITSRSQTQRTRLVERRSWEQPVIAANVTREVPQVNSGWVPVPAPTQLVQK